LYRSLYRSLVNHWPIWPSRHSLIPGTGSVQRQADRRAVRR